MNSSTIPPALAALAAKAEGFDHLKVTLQTIIAVSRAHRKTGSTRKALAVAGNMATLALTHVMPIKPGTWTAEQTITLWLMRLNGSTTDAIAYATGQNPGAVARKIHLMSLDRPTPRKRKPNGEQP